GGGKLAIRCYGEIVQPSSYRDALYKLQGGGVDDIQGPLIIRRCGGIPNTDDDLLSIPRGLGFIGPTADRHLFDNPFALAIHDDEEVLSPAENVELAAVARELNHLGCFDVVDRLHDFVRRSVDHGDGGAASVRDIDQGRTCR